MARLGDTLSIVADKYDIEEKKTLCTRIGIQVIAKYKTDKTYLQRSLDII